MNQRLDTSKFRQRTMRHGYRPADSGLLGSPFIRVLLGWVLSLGVLATVVNLPMYPKKGNVGWQSIAPDKQIVLLPMPPEEKEEVKIEGSPVTVLVQPEKITDPLPDAKNRGNKEEEPIIEQVMQPQKLERIDTGPILEFVDESPAIVGGLSTLYLSIDYPKSARDQGIEGLTVLMFIVEKDGSTRNISVYKPLHPALDSAAVAAVRKTLFKPGRLDGKVVRVKMRLPIRFRLVNPAKPEPVIPELVDSISTVVDP